VISKAACLLPANYPAAPGLLQPLTFLLQLLTTCLFMPLTFIFRWVLACLLLLGSLPAAWASHLLGGDITYAPVAATTAGVPRYHVVIRQFLNVGNDGARSATLTATQDNCAAPTASFTVQVPRTQLLDGVALTCFIVSPAYQVAVHEIDIDLPAGEWLLNVSEPSRTAGVLNITNSSFYNFYISAYLNSGLSPQNTSPKFESALLPIFSPGGLTPYSFSTFDADGDSLRYELLLPVASCTQNIPATLTPHFGLHAGTGALLPVATTASTQGYYNVTVRVNEYRKLTNNRWVLIGYVTRDTSYGLSATSNQPPTFTTMQVNGGAAQSLGLPIRIQPSQLVTVTLQATDPDAAQTLRFASSATQVVPGLSLTRVGTTNGVQLAWQVPAALPPGRYAVPVAVLDNGCPYNASDERTLTFVVGSTALATRVAAAATDVFPVPFREQVQFTTAANQAIIVVDALGREVARLSSAPNGLVRWQPAPTLPAGLYIARAASTGQPLARLLRAE
jgi:hypothetical protein